MSFPHCGGSLEPLDSLNCLSSLENRHFWKDPPFWFKGGCWMTSASLILTWAALPDSTPESNSRTSTSTAARAETVQKKELQKPEVSWNGNCPSDRGFERGPERCLPIFCLIMKWKTDGNGKHGRKRKKKRSKIWSPPRTAKMENNRKKRERKERNGKKRNKRRKTKT